MATYVNNMAGIDPPGIDPPGIDPPTTLSHSSQDESVSSGDSFLRCELPMDEELLMGDYTDNGAGAAAAADPPLLPRPGGACLGYRDLEEAGFVSEPQDEMFNPECAPADTGPLNELEAVSDDVGVLDHSEVPPISLLRQYNATEAYAILPQPKPISLDHHHPGWGVVVFGLVYPCIGPGRFRCPTRRADQRYVAIKKLRKTVVHRVLEQQGQDIGADDPYKEVARMRELQDGNFVLTCIDFLEDEEFLYIVTPRGKTLRAVVWSNPRTRMPAAQAIDYFHRILKIVDYLHSRGINHHDLSPDNVLLMPEGNLVVFDLAKSVRMPVNPRTGHRGLMHHRSAFGTKAWMSPEVLRQRPYDGCAMDIWAAAIIFYNLLTGCFLYNLPLESDDQFYLFVHRGGLRDVQLTRSIIDGIKEELRHRQQGQSESTEDHRLVQKLSRISDAHSQLAPEVRDLLGALLKTLPAERPTMTEVMQNNMFRGLG